MLTLITGPDSHLVRTEIDRLKSQLDPDGLNTSIFDAKTNALEEIVIALGTPGFFGGQRLVIVHDLMARSSKSAASEEDDDAPAKAGAVDWQRVFGSISAGTNAVFADRDLRSVPAAVKKQLPVDARVVTCEPPRGNELVSWMTERARAAGSSMSPMTANVLAELLCPTTWRNQPTNPAYDRPPDLEQFANEIDKLALAAFPGAIESAHIHEMSAAGQVDRLFPLIDSLIAGESGTAIDHLRDTIGSGDEAARVSAQLFQQAELLGALDAAGRLDPVEAGRKLGLSNPNRMLAISKGLRRFRGRPTALVDSALEADRQLKSGVLRQPTDQLYSLVDRTLASSQTRRNDGN
jgi:DNA polymerase III delta subunit